MGLDTLVGTDGRDVILGRDGNDRIQAGEGNDFVCGNAGGDHLDGGGGSDRIDGGLGSIDYIHGESCGPEAPCDEGNDVLLNGEEVYGGGGTTTSATTSRTCTPTKSTARPGFDTCVVTPDDNADCEVVRRRVK
jgi:hypothetical protein